MFYYMLHKQTPGNSWRAACQKAKSAVSLLLILPLIECAVLNTAMPNGKKEAPNASMTAVNGNFKCRFTPQYEMILFDSIDGTAHWRVNLDMPKGVDLSDPIFFSCHPNITVIATQRYMVRSMGYEDAALGKLMLGALGDRFYPQNMLAWDMAPLGQIKQVDFFAPIKGFHGNEAAVETETGKFYRIDLDNPAALAKEL